MLYLTTNESKILTVTLNDNPYHIWNFSTWKITSLDTNIDTVFTAPNLSGSPYYASFSFSAISGATMGITAGVIPVDRGQYRYFIYGSDTPDNLIIDEDKLIENGILSIRGTVSNDIEFTYNQTYITFKN
jgi:hypothetical protein